MDCAMSEDTSGQPDDRQKEVLASTRRQEGDGNDCCTSRNNPTVPAASPVRDSNPAGTKASPDREIAHCPDRPTAPLGGGEPADVTDQEISANARQASVNNSKLLMVHSSNVSRATKDLRHQSRQLQSQDLIRRILQSTAEVQGLVLQQKPGNLGRQNGVLGSSDNTSSTGSETARESAGENEHCESSHDSIPRAEDEQGAFQRVDSSTAAGVSVEGVGREIFGQLPSIAPSSSMKTQPQPTMTSEVSGAQSPVASNSDRPAQGNVDSMNPKGSPRDILFSEAAASSRTVKEQNPPDPDNFVSGAVLQPVQEGADSPRSLDQTIDQQSGNTTGAGTAPHGPPDVHKLGEKLQRSPTQETLKEILQLLRQQSQPPHEDSDAQGSVQMDESLATSGYQSQVTVISGGLPGSPSTSAAAQVHLRNQANLQGQHSQQLSDVKSYYESELEKMHVQLDGLRGNLSSLEGVLPMKMLEATNHKLEQRCQLLEEIADELKSKCDKLESANLELDTTCCQLHKSNQALEIRYYYLEQANEVLAAKQLKLQETVQRLESRLVEFAESHEWAETRCQQLEKAGRDSAEKIQQLEGAREKLESLNEKLMVEIQDLAAASEKMRETLLATSRHSQALEGKLLHIEAEREDWFARIAANKEVSTDVQRQVQEIRAQSLAKDELIHKLEDEMKGKDSAVSKVNKGQAEFEENAKRDKELLQNLLIEYDSLVKEHQLAQMREKGLASRLQSSEVEMNELRGAVSKLVKRNSSLEDSLKDSLLRFSRDDSWSADSRVESPASPRPPEFSAPVRDRVAHGAAAGAPTKGHVSATKRATPYSSKPRGPSPVKSELNRGAALVNSKVDEPRFIPPSKSTSTPLKSPKRSLDRGSQATSPSPKAVRSPANLVVKKADLVTRFDVVFEDVTSGELVSRSHSGRTVKSYDSPDGAQSGTVPRKDSPSSSPESTVQDTLEAIRGGKVMSVGDWEGPVKKGKNRNAEDKSTNHQTPRRDSEYNTMRNSVVELERKLSSLMDERKRLESTLSRIPAHRPTKRAKEDKAYLENRLDEVTQDIGSVRMRLRRLHAL